MVKNLSHLTARHIDILDVLQNHHRDTLNHSAAIKKVTSKQQVDNLLATPERPLGDVKLNGMTLMCYVDCQWHFKLVQFWHS